MDRFHERLVPGEFELALTVLARVVSRQGSTVVLDCGRKSVATDFGPPALAGRPEGQVRLVARSTAPSTSTAPRRSSSATPPSSPTATRPRA